MPTPQQDTQTYQNHTMFDPLFHYAIMPLLTLNFAFSFSLFVRHRHDHPHITAWWIVLSFTFVLLAMKTRFYALKNQDRLIRLEERLRLASLLPPTEHAALNALTIPQLIALRFASDAELPTLARRTLAENLEPKQIKQAIQTWRPDLHRI